jgi:hypothetical protein
VTTEEALELVEVAFRDAPRPTNSELLHPRSADDMDLVSLYDIENWRDMTDEDVIGAYAALSFLSAAGFRHFVPAFMSYSLRNPNSAEAVVSSTVWGFDPSLYDEKLAHYVRSKYELLEPDERHAVAAFLEAMIPYEPDAQRALDQWRTED